MLRQSLNEVKIVGRLNEIDLREGVASQGKNAGRKYISGRVNVLVEQSISGSPEQEVIPVNVFAFETTNAGTPNPAYQNISDVLHNGTSIAATGDATKADVYEVTRGSLREHTYQNRSGQTVDFTEVQSNFFMRRVAPQIEEATFDEEIVIAQMSDEVRDDEPTGRLLIDGLVVQWGGRPDKIQFVVENPDAINWITQNWQADDTVRLSGKIRFGTESISVETESEVGFGEPLPQVRRRFVREFVVTAGYPPYDEDRRYDIDEIVAARAQKKAADEEAARAQAARQNTRSSVSATPNVPRRSTRGF